MFIVFSGESKIQPEYQAAHPLPSADTNTEQNNLEVELNNLVVDVKGAVTSPGVYEMEEGMRVNDVIQQAGGFTDSADTSQVNLAQKLMDEMVIIVPDLSDGTAPVSESNNNSNNGKVRLNYATREEIESLNGIGPSKAQAIIQYRDENGLFHSIEDLLEISGIGEKTLEQMKDSVQVP
ncbi:helix-hairpin-helix domain-containing protein [Oceanobacillus senegalensis]|uniref:helix-hairpin-helix domain-containing protein n=1 Tax=Oceanobacillus senegalensis TaxID=1936063 RepID=UPI000A30F4D4|nr:helix-hairpin-helix domain-containing protein [Oceanobacillus senegalensis]